MNSVLKINKDYVYNSSNDWYTCVISDEDQFFSIKCIPPLSCRYFPNQFKNPNIASLTRLENPLNKNTNSLLNLKSAAQVLDLNFTAEYDGYITIRDKQNINATVKINKDKIQGWFSSDGNLFFFEGSINTEFHTLSMTLYVSDGSIYPKLIGNISKEESSVFFEVSLGNLVLNLRSVGLEDKPAEICEISANYTVFQGFDDKDAAIIGDSNGFIRGKLYFQQSIDTLFGCFKKDVLSVFIISNTQDKTMYITTIKDNGVDYSLNGILRRDDICSNVSFIRRTNLADADLN